MYPILGQMQLTGRDQQQHHWVYIDVRSPYHPKLLSHY